MWSPRFQLAGFESISEDDRLAVFDCLLEGLVRANLGWLKLYPVPPLYGGTKYVPEPPGEDVWQDIPRTIQLQGGDCEDVASWRCAELRFHGESRARCEMQKWTKPGGKVEYHVVVRRADGSMEDPSRLLGMK